jgi:integrase
MGYCPGELHTNNSGWYIDYYVLHPKTLATVRKRIRLNRVPPGKTKELYARTTLRKLNEKLARGWNPFTEQDVPNAMHSLERALEVWLQNKTKNTRHSSPQSYSTFTSVFAQWCTKRDLMSAPAHMFNRNHAIEFLAYVSDERQVGNTTYNNYLVFFSMLMKWMIERGYRTDNPFVNFTRRKEPKKARVFLTEEDRMQMAEWIRQNNPALWLPCLFLYGTLIRPAELRRLRVSAVQFDRGTVYLGPDVTKNGDERWPAIPDWMMKELVAAGLHKQPGNAWLMGNELVPGGIQASKHFLMRRWQNMANALHWPKSKQLYSLRDTGIIQLIRDGVELLHVMQQADHKDLATTNRYVRHAFPKGPPEVREKATPLQATSPLVMAQPLYNGASGSHNPIPRFEQMERNS